MSPRWYRDAAIQWALFNDLHKVGRGCTSMDMVGTQLKMLTDVPDDLIYRINIGQKGSRLTTKGSSRIEATDKIIVTCFGMEKVDSFLEGSYDSVSELPIWVQERLAVLSMLSAKPPTEELAGVGIRIDETTYWVYKPTS